MKTPDDIKKALEMCAYEQRCDNCPYGGVDCADLETDALEYIKQLEAAQMKWISVDDRVPEQFVSVLVYMPGEYHLPTVREGYLRPDGKWDAAYYTRTPDEVTHWANMPEPPKVDA